jgi:hypothetical protein
MVCAGCGAEFNGAGELCATCRRLAGDVEPGSAPEARPFVVSRSAGQPAAGAPAAGPAATGSAVRIVLVGGLVLVAVAVGALVVSFADRPTRLSQGKAPLSDAGVLLVRRAPASAPASRPSEPLALPPTCDGVPCQPVPRGLKKWQFGMTVAEARALPEKTTPLKPVDLGSLPAKDGKRTRVSAPRLEVRTTLADHPATCTLVFAVEGRLSQMSCRLDSKRNLDGHRELEGVVLKALRGRYGTERRFWPHHTLANQRGHDQHVHGGRYYRYRTWEHLGRWAWFDDAARMELVSEFERWGFRRTSSLLEVQNASAAHQELLRKLEAAAPASTDL